MRVYGVVFIKGGASLARLTHHPFLAPLFHYMYLDEFHSVAQKKGLDVAVKIKVRTDGAIAAGIKGYNIADAVRRVLNMGIRIVNLNIYDAEMTRQLFCVAYKLKALEPGKSVWLRYGWFADEWWNKTTTWTSTKRKPGQQPESFECSREEMAVASDGSLGVQSKILRVDGGGNAVINITGQTVTQWKTELTRRVVAENLVNDMGTDQKAERVDPSQIFDSIVAFAYALDHAVKTKGIAPEHLGYPESKMHGLEASKLVETIGKLTFTGASGQVTWNQKTWLRDQLNIVVTNQNSSSPLAAHSPLGLHVRSVASVFSHRASASRFQARFYEGVEVHWGGDATSAPGDGKATASGRVPPPDVLSVSPRVLSVEGGETIMIEGTGFDDTGVPTVLLGGKPCTLATAEDSFGTRVSCVTPPGTNGNVLVAVYARGSVSVSAYTVEYKKPLIRNINVTWGVEGSACLVSGSGFTTKAAILCKTGSGSSPVRGVVLSSVQVVCPLGAGTHDHDYALRSLGTSPPRLSELYVSQDDGRRWSSPVRSRESVIRWTGGGEPPIGTPRPKVIRFGILIGSNTSTCYRAIHDKLAEINSESSVFLPGTTVVAEHGFYTTADGTHKERAVQEAERLHAEKGVVAFLGPGWSSVASAVASKATGGPSARLMIPTIGLMTTADELSSTAKFPYFLRNGATNNGMAGFVSQTLAHFGWSRIAIITSDDGFAGNLGNEVKAAFLNDNPGVAGNQAIAFHGKFNQPSAVVDAAIEHKVGKLVSSAAAAHPAARVFFVAASRARSVGEQRIGDRRVIGGGGAVACKNKRIDNHTCLSNTLSPPSLTSFQSLNNESGCAAIIRHIAQRAFTDKARTAGVAGVAESTGSPSSNTTSIESALFGYSFLVSDTCSSAATFKFLRDSFGVNVFTPGRGLLGLVDAVQVNTPAQPDLDVFQSIIYDTCADAMLLLASALETGTSQGVITLTDSNHPSEKTRKLVLGLLRSSSLDASNGIRSGTGKLWFQKGSNDRDSSTFRFGLVNAIQHTVAAAPTSVFIGSVSTDGVNIDRTSSIDGSLSNPAKIQWPANYANDLNTANQNDPPRDRDIAAIPSEAAILVIDDRIEVCEWTKKAVIEVNENSALLPFTKLRATVIFDNSSLRSEYDSTSTGGHINAYVDAFVAACRRDSLPIAAVVLRGSTFVQTTHNRHAVHDYLLVSPRAAATELENATAYPNYISIGFSNRLITRAMVQAMSSFSFRRFTLLYDERTLFSMGLGKSVLNIGEGLGKTVRKVDCGNVTALNQTDWGAVSAFSPILAVTAYRSSMYNCLREVAASGFQFQLVIVYMARRLTDVRFGMLDLSTQSVMDGAIGISGLVRLNDSPRVETFKAFWNAKAAAVGGGVEASSISGEAIQLYDTVFAVAHSVDRCLAQGRWFYVDRGPNNTNAADQKACLMEAPVQGLQGGIRHEAATNAAIFDAGFTLQNYRTSTNATAATLPVGVELNDVVYAQIEPTGTHAGATVINAGVVSGVQDTLRICATNAEIGSYFVGSTCLDKVMSPVLDKTNGVVVVNATSIHVEWSHQAPSDASVLTGFKVLVRDTYTDKIISGSNQYVGPKVFSAHLLVRGTDFEGEENKMVQGTMYKIRVSAIYTGVSASIHSHSRKICIGRLHQAGTCGCQEETRVGYTREEYHSRGKPHVPPHKWRCMPCPTGTVCGGKTWDAIQTKPNWFLALPTCAGHVETSTDTRADTSACKADLRLLKCPVPDDPREPLACPGKFTASHALQLMRRDMTTSSITPSSPASYNATTNDQCGAGYAGFECKACLDGYTRSRSKQTCSACSTANNVFTAGVLGGIAVVLLLVVAAFIVWRRVKNSGSAMDAKLKQFMVWLVRKEGVRQLRTLFRAIDDDGNGMLDKKVGWRWLNGWVRYHVCIIWVGG